MKLSKKKTCGFYDCSAGLYSGCRARVEYPDRDYCALGFKMNKGIPLEPCYKPTKVSELFLAEKLVRENR